MPIEIVHISLVHQRIDIRIFSKQCVSLKQSGIGNISFLVADGNGDELASGVRIIDVGKPNGGRTGRAIYGSLQVWKKLKIIKSDVLHLHDPELLPLGLLMKLGGKTVIYDMHENLPMAILTKPYLNKFIRAPLSFLLYKFQSFLLRFMPVVFAENSYPKDFKSVKKYAIVLNFPLVDEMKKRDVVKKRSQFTVGYLGGISAERGALMQLNVVEELRSEGLDITTLFIGPVAEDVLRSEIYERATSKGWATFTGRVKPELGWAKISECHVGFAILKPSPNYIESYPTKLFEYMILGLPCIVSDFPLYRKIVDESECGLLVDPLDKDKIKASVRWIVNNPQNALEMGLKGNACVTEKYSWSSEFKKLENLYKELLVSLK
jgi:glycosyltransferase involved in cell wall biosynthesis